MFYGKKLLFLLGCIGCLIGIVLTIVVMKFIAPKYNDYKKDVIRLEYGQTMPFNDFTYLGDRAETQNSKINVFLYIDPRCDTCVEKERIIERLYELCNSDDININILWKKTPNNKKIQSLNIPDTNQLATTEVDFTNEYPLYVISDGSKKVILLTDSEEKLLKSLCDVMGDEEYLMDCADNYFKAKASDTSKKTVVYFALEGCPDCERVMSNGDIIKALKKYDLQTLYTADSYGEKPFVDDGSLFKFIYNIEWYPSFLIFEDKHRIIIGEKPDSEVLFDLEHYH